MSFRRDLLKLIRAFERDEMRQVKLATKRWQRQQSAVAELLGGREHPDIGKPGPDVIAHPFAVELKTTNKLPQWLTGAMKQASRNAHDGLLPLVVLAEVRQGRKAKRYAVLHFEDLTTFVAAKGQLEGPSGESPEV